jgi:hypothetical protein
LIIDKLNVTRQKEVSEVLPRKKTAYPLVTLNLEGGQRQFPMMNRSQKALKSNHYKNIRFFYRRTGGAMAQDFCQSCHLQKDANNTPVTNLAIAMLPPYLLS